MNPADLPLRDIHLPPPPPWWPPAPGWWALLALIMCAALAAWVWRRRRTRRRGAMDEARAVLMRLRAGATEMDVTTLAAELSALLRRVCVSLWPREQAAGLTGEGWLQFLDRAQGGNEFMHGAGRLLIQAPYRPGATRAEVHALLEACARWIEAVQRQRQDGGRS